MPHLSDTLRSPACQLFVVVFLHHTANDSSTPKRKSLDANCKLLDGIY